MELKIDEKNNDNSNSQQRINALKWNNDGFVYEFIGSFSFHKTQFCCYYFHGI